MTVENFTRLALTIAAISQTLYALGWLTVTFWTSLLGRAHVLKSWALALILDLLVFGWWFGVPDVAWAVLSSALAIGATYQLGVFIRERWFTDEEPRR